MKWILIAIVFWLCLATEVAAQVRTQTANFTLTWDHVCCKDPKVNDAADGFYVLRRVGGGSLTRVATTLPTPFTYRDTIAADDGANTYCYVVQAFNKVGTSGNSNEACATTPKVEATPMTPSVKQIIVDVQVQMSIR